MAGLLALDGSLRELDLNVALCAQFAEEVLPFRLAEVLPAGLTHLGLTEDMVSQYGYGWDEELVLEELDAFLGVWRSVTPDLQAVDVLICKSYRWKDADVARPRMICEEAGLLCTLHKYIKHSCSLMDFQLLQPLPTPKPLPRRGLLCDEQRPSPISLKELQAMPW